MCRDNFSGWKVSLHASGSWRVGFTEDFAVQRPDIIRPGRDRVLKKWKPDLSSAQQAVIGFQVIALSSSLYLTPIRRASWPNSVLFVEPDQDTTVMTVISVVVAPSQFPIRVTAGMRGAVIAVLPLGLDRSVQLVATREPAGNTEELVAKTLDKIAPRVEQVNGEECDRITLLHGNRGNDVPWVIAVPMDQRARC